MAAASSAAELGRAAWHRARRTPPLRVLQLLLAAAAAAALLAAAAKGGARLHRRWRCSGPPRGDPQEDAEGYTAPFYPRPTAYQDSAPLARPPDACAAALGLPQVALLFLTKGDILHEALWREWFQAAAGQLPEGSVRRAACTGGGKWRGAAAERALAACAPDPADADPLRGQHLYDVWVHPHPNFTGFAPGSLFAGRELPPSFRVHTEWGTHTLVDATRALLAAALTNPRASKFVLLSESDAPLYSPLALHRQLAGERASRVNACNASGWDIHDGQRWREDTEAAGLPRHLFRKSWQWVALARAHAELAVADVDVDAVFRATCRQRWDCGWCTHRICYPDEHYLPTLLAWHGRDNESDCSGELTDRDWARVAVGTPHPYEYPPHEVTPGLLRALRHAERPGCAHAHAFAAQAPALYLHAPALLGGGAPAAGGGGEPGEALCGAAPRHGPRPLGPACPLLARKFVNATVGRTLAAARSPCLGVLHPLPPGGCSAEEEEAEAEAEAEAELAALEAAPARARRGGGAGSWALVALCVCAAVAAAARWGVHGWLAGRRRRRLPMARNETFHTALKSHGIL